MHPGILNTFKDHKHYESRKAYKTPLDLRGFEVDVPADYNTKKHSYVFRLRHSSTGAEYLFETHNEVCFLKNFKMIVLNNFFLNFKLFFIHNKL